jgi:hypothetical protein
MPEQAFERPQIGRKAAGRSHPYAEPPCSGPCDGIGKALPNATARHIGQPQLSISVTEQLLQWH